MEYNAKEHWETVYQTKKPDEVSWYQKKPQTALNLIAELNVDKNSAIIDFGAGDSLLVDNLLALGFKNITVLDISPTAINKAKKRVGDKSAGVKWVVSDLREFKTEDRYDLWHDRAVLHFLTREEDINAYVELVRRLVKPNGHLIVSTFSLNGPQKCSGLDVKQYSEDSMKNLFHDFKHIKSFEEKHVTPFGTVQNFIYCVFKKKEPIIGR